MKTVRVLGTVLAILSAGAHAFASEAGSPPPGTPAVPQYDPSAPAASAPASISASGPTSTHLLNGKIQALIVIGKVELVDATGTRKALNKGDVFEEGNVIICGPQSGVTLVFSNGAIVRLKENAQLGVMKFQQAPFDTAKEGEFIRLTHDPSQSITDLDLRNGTVQAEVKKLNTAQRSTFNIHTPAGSANIRGTIVSISVIRDAAGNVTGITATSAVGSFSFIPASGTALAITGTGEAMVNSHVNVDQGATIQIALQVSANGIPTGVEITGAKVESAAIQAQVTQLFDAINAIQTTGGSLFPAPTVSATDNITTGTGSAVSRTVTATIDAPTAPITNIIPPSPPTPTPSANPGATSN